LRVITVLVNIRRPAPHKSASSPCRAMVVLGSGGHTAEMLTLISGLDRARYAPIVFVAALGDTNSLQRIEQFEVRFSVQRPPHSCSHVLSDYHGTRSHLSVNRNETGRRRINARTQQSAPTAHHHHCATQPRCRSIMADHADHDTSRAVVVLYRSGHASS
jgi:hypothetical protein